MSKFFGRLFGRGSSFRGSQSSINEHQSQSKTSSSARTTASLENLASYHVIPKELEKNKLHKASWEGNLHKVERLARPGQINLKDQQMRTPIHLAVVKGHIEIVKYLVQENAKLDVVDNEQRTPLIKAVLSGNQNPQLNYEICKVLIDGGAGVYINAIDKHGRNALHYAIDFGNHHLVDLFLSNENCDPNFKDRDQMTPLHLAIKRNSPQIVQLLLSDQQADPNIINRYGQTPLHIAASVGYIDIVRLLLLSNLDEPCDPTILDSQQLTAYELAKANHQEACAKLIQEYQSKIKEQRKTTTSFNEQLSIKATNSISMIPAANLQRDHDETSDDSTSISTTKPSKSSPKRVKRSSDQWSDENDTSINESKPGSHGINSLFKINPLQPDEIKTGNSALNNLFNNNPLQTNLKKTTPASQQTKSSLFFGIGPVTEREDSDNTSMSVSIDKPVKQTQPVSLNKPVTSNQYVNVALQPASNAKSWSDDTITASPIKKKEPQSNSWDTSVSDDDSSVSKPKPTSANLQKTHNLPSSDSDNNSVETEIRKFDSQKPTNETTVQHIVNKQVGDGYKVIGLSKVQSPLSDDSTWISYSLPVNKEPTTKGVHNLVQQPKTDESTWDDSRPLSADLKAVRNSNNLSDIQTTGVENLIKMMDTIIHSNKKQTSPKMMGKLLVSSMVDRTDSRLSQNTLHEIDHDEDYEQSWKKKTEEWSVTAPNKHEFKTLQQLPRSSLPYDINNLHGSVSSTKSSFNDIQINELKENIKKLERNQEDARELKRQLTDMENKKNDFENLYKQNDQMLRDIENKLGQEINEKQRLESTTKNLNMELKSIQQKLQSLQEEKDLLSQRCFELKEERDNHNEKLRTLHTSDPQSTATISSSRDDNVDKIKSRHREEMKSLSAANDDLHYRTKQLQSDLQLHKESLDVTLRYKIDLEKALEEKTYFQHELDRLKYEKDSIEQEKFEYKTKYDSLQDEIHRILFDRSKLEQKLTGELQEHLQEKQQSTDDLRRYQSQIEQLNMKLNDAETRLLTLQTQRETLLTTKDHHTKNEYEPIPERLNKIYDLNQPLVVLTSAPLNNRFQSQNLNQTFPQEKHNNENYLIENSRQIRSDTQRVKSELDRLREDFDKLVSNYEPTNNFHHQTQIHSQIDTFRQFYEQEFRQRQLLMSKLTNGIKPATINNYHRTPSSSIHPGSSSLTNNRLLKERLEIPIDRKLIDQRSQTIPRQASALLTINTTNNGVMSSVELLRQHYHA